MLNFDKDLLYEQVDNFQLQRHDFLNYFQVIKGYLQLNMPEKALEYIDETIVSLSFQQEIYKINQKTLMSILLGMYFGLRISGVNMEFRIPSEMKNEEYWHDRWKEEYAEQFYGYTKDCTGSVPRDTDPEQLFAEIQILTDDHGFGCDFRLLRNDELIYRSKYYSEGA